MLPKVYCAYCSKKLTISNQFACDCENIFCSAHRYRESHNCKMMSSKIFSEKKKLEHDMQPLKTKKVEAL